MVPTPHLPRPPTGLSAIAAAHALSLALRTAEGVVGVVGWPLEADYPAPVTEVLGLASIEEAIASAASLDAVVLVGVLAGLDSEAKRFPELAQALKPNGRLYYCEPTLGLGIGSVVQRFTRTDIQAVIRAAGMRPTTIHRFTAGSPKSLNNFMAGEARWYENL